jgi:CPA2 family monovalent cation:H+ antiporter-2
MAHLPQLIQDLALILMVAAFVSLTFKKMRQPVVLGYLVAGMLVGPHQTLFPQVTDLSGIGIWADIGLIFLLFAIGLEFSFRKLARLGAAPGITAAFETSMMAVTGFVTGYALDWPLMDSLFFGAMLAISSTTVLIKTFDELGLKGRRFVSLVIGVLIFEDIIAVIMMVLLTTVALTRDVQLPQVVMQVSRLVFFLGLWFMVGVFALPHVTKRIRPLLNAESTLIISLGLCFGMVVLATRAGFTPALGAFVMGSLLAETSEGERIERVVRSVKDLFSAVFFISVGMLMNPAVLVHQAPLVLLLTVILVCAKVLFVTMGALLAGQPPKTAFLAGMSLPQIGEFSYIIAGLGLSLGVVSESLYPLAVAISVITAFSTPYTIRVADSAFRFLEKTISPKWQRTFNLSHPWQVRRSPLKIQGFLKEFCLKMLLHGILVVAIFLIMSEGVLPWAERNFPDRPLMIGLLTGMTILICTPFYWGLAFSSVDGESFSRVWKSQHPKPAVVLLGILRFMASVALLTVLISQFLFEDSAIFLVVTSLFLFTVLFYGPLERIYGFIEGVFLKNLRTPAKTTEEVNMFEMPPLAPWDAHLVEFVVPSEAECIGQPLQQLQIRERFGISLALIKRGERRITAPGRGEMLMPLDHIFAIGTDEQLLKFKRFLDQERKLGELQSLPVDYSLEKFSVAPLCELAGKSIRDSGIRESTKGLIVGLERAGVRILNPDSSLELQAGDTLWIVGDRGLIRNLERRVSPAGFSGFL